MPKTRHIKNRIKEVGNITRITKTMQLIATAQFQAAQRRATASQPYTRKIAELVNEVASSMPAEGDATHPLLKAPSTKTGRELILVITSNRGLAGAYNGNILRTGQTYLRTHTDTKPVLEVVGKKGAAFLKYNKREVAAVHSQFTDKPSFIEVEKLAERYMKEFAEGKYDAVKVLSMQFISMGRQVPGLTQLLPMEDPAQKSKGEQRPGGAKSAVAKPDAAVKAKVVTEYEFSPNPAELLAELLPITVKTRLFQAFIEAIVSEQLARMIAMKAATDAGKKMGKLLTRKYNRARQAAITTELTEIISGAAALG